jgi:hypothetical protein
MHPPFSRGNRKLWPVFGHHRIKTFFLTLFAKVTTMGGLRWMSLFGGIVFLTMSRSFHDLEIHEWSASTRNIFTGYAPVSSNSNDNMNNNNKNDNLYSQHHFPSVGIFVAADARSQELYDKNLRSIHCYGKRHGYDVILISDLNQTKVTTMLDRTIDLTRRQTKSSRSSCWGIQSFSFQRQCVVSRILPYYDFLVVLDADVGVANANVTIESILLRTSRGQTSDLRTSSITRNVVPHVILEERFHTGEIMAASFILQNTSFAQEFLQRWINFYYTLPEPKPLGPNKFVNKFYHNQRDNPSLNIAFLETLADVAIKSEKKYEQPFMTQLKSPTTERAYQSLIDNCYRLWELSIGSQKYMNYLRCVHNATLIIIQDSQQRSRDILDDASVLFPLYLFRRGNGGLGRDIQTCLGYISPLDVFVHNLKEHSALLQHAYGFYQETPTCQVNVDSSFQTWQSPVSANRWKSMKDMKDLLKTPACFAKSTQIGHCWPKCNITDFVM